MQALVPFLRAIGQSRLLSESAGSGVGLTIVVELSSSGMKDSTMGLPDDVQGGLMVLLVLSTTEVGFEAGVVTCIGVEVGHFFLEYTCNGRGVLGTGSSNVILSESFGPVVGRGNKNRS